MNDEIMTDELTNEEKKALNIFAAMEQYIVDSRRTDKMYRRYAEYKRKQSKKCDMLDLIAEKSDAKIKEFRDKCIDYHDGVIKDTTGATIEYKTGSKCGNIIGDRIRVILEKHNISITEFEEISKINRSSLQRFLKKDEPDIPSMKNLIIIIQSLPCIVEDFVYSVDDFEKWKDGFLNGYLIPWGKKNIVDFDMFRTLLPDLLNHSLVYTNDDKRYMVPQYIVELLAKQINVAFEMAETLLEYEKNATAQPKGYYDLPTREEIEDMFYIGI